MEIKEYPRQDLIKIAQDALPGLIDRYNKIKKYEGQPMVFRVSTEPCGVFDSISFDGQDWFYSYRVGDGPGNMFNIEDVKSYRVQLQQCSVKLVKAST